MSYTPTTWSCGDTITAEKLNKLENGLAECCGGGSGLICTATVSVNADNYECYVLDKTWQEIHDAMAQGRNVIINQPASSPTYDMFPRVLAVVEATENIDNNEYGVTVIAWASTVDYMAHSPNGFPVYTYGE